MKRWLMPLGLLMLLLPSLAGAMELAYYDREKGSLVQYQEGGFRFLDGSRVDPQPLAAFQAFDQKHQVLIVPARGEQGAQLRIVEIKTGTVVKTCPLGATVIKWARSEDRRHLFVGYKTEAKAERFDLLHYDLTGMKAEVLPGFGLKLYDLAVARDSSQVYCTHGIRENEKEKANGTNVLSILTVPSFKVKGQIPVNNYDTEQIQVLGPERIALLEIRRGVVLNQPAGNVKLVDVSAGKVLDQRDFYAGAFEYEVIPARDRLLVVNYKLPGMIGRGNRGSKSTCNVIVAGADGLTQKEFTDYLVSSQYDPAGGQLTMVMSRSIAILEPNGTVTQFRIKANFATDEATRNATNVCLLKKSNRVAVHNTAQETVTFFQVNQPEPLAEISAGRGAKSFFKDVVGATEILEKVELGQKLGTLRRKMISSETPVSVAENPRNEGYYLYNRHTNSLMVYNAKFRKVANRELPDKLVGFYQLSKWGSAALVSTAKGLYRIDFETDQVVPVYPFKNYAVTDSVCVDGPNLVYFTDKEVAVIDPATWKVKSSLEIVTKENKQRYFMVD